MIDVLKIVEEQNAIIRAQGDIVDELFVLLMQHLPADEVARLSVLEKMRRTANRSFDVGARDVPVSESDMQEKQSVRCQNLT